MIGVGMADQEVERFARLAAHEMQDFVNVHAGGGMAVDLEDAVVGADVGPGGGRARIGRADHDQLRRIAQRANPHADAAELLADLGLKRIGIGGRERTANAGRRAFRSTPTIASSALLNSSSLGTRSSAPFSISSKLLATKRAYGFCSPRTKQAYETASATSRITKLRCGMDWRTERGEGLLRSTYRPPRRASTPGGESRAAVGLPVALETEQAAHVPGIAARLDPGRLRRGS